MPNNLLTPITRNNMFYSEEDFEYETNLLMEYIEEDLNQTVVVYEVDRQKTNVSAVYKEAKVQSTKGNTLYVLIERG